MRCYSFVCLHAEYFGQIHHARARPACMDVRRRMHVLARTSFYFGINEADKRIKDSLVCHKALQQGRGTRR